MEKGNTKWIVLAAYALLTVALQLQWLAVAPIARVAKDFWVVSSLDQIDLLSIVYMGVFILVSIPASYILDTYGLRKGVGFGAILTAIFSITKGIWGTNYTVVLLSQIGLAVAQPFVLNAATKVGAHWFEKTERAIAVGIATLAQFLGIILAMTVSPWLISSSMGYSIDKVLMIYGIVSVLSAVAVLFVMGDGSADDEERDSFKEGFKRLTGNKGMIIMVVMFFIGLGVFNAVSTVIDRISLAKGFTVDQTGNVGGIMFISGIIGALILPALSDKLMKRKPFIIISMFMAAVGLGGFIWFTSYYLVLVSVMIFGFFLLGGGAPIGFQYNAEISVPIPESTSQGFLLLAGQISGILFIVSVQTAGTGLVMVFFVALLLVNVLLGFLLKEHKPVV